MSRTRRPDQARTRRSWTCSTGSAAPPRPRCWPGSPVRRTTRPSAPSSACSRRRGTSATSRTGCATSISRRVARHAARKAALRHLVETFFDGSAASAVTALLGRDAGRLTDEDLDRIDALVQVGPQGGEVMVLGILVLRASVALAAALAVALVVPAPDRPRCDTSSWPSGVATAVLTLPLPRLMPAWEMAPPAAAERPAAASEAAPRPPAPLQCATVTSPAMPPAGRRWNVSARGGGFARVARSAPWRVAAPLFARPDRACAA